MKSKQMLSIRIPIDMNKALSDKVKPVGMSKCQYILSLIGKDLGMIADFESAANESKEAAS